MYLSSNKMGLIKYLNDRNINDIELFELIKLTNSSKYYELSQNNYYYQNSNRILMNEPIKLREKYSFEEIMLNNYLNYIDLLNNNIIENDIYLLYTINILINKYNINNDKIINLSKNIITNSINNCSKSDDYYKYGIKTLKKINKSFK